MISIKKYLDADVSIAFVDGPEPTELLGVTMDAYRSALLAIGKSAVHACPAPGHDLEQTLASVEARLSTSVPPEVLKESQEQVEAELDKWGSLTTAHLRGKADGVKELLIMLASTAESVGDRDKRYANQVGGFTADLRAMADLDDLTQIRSSLVRKATELRNCVDEMTRDGERSLAQLRSKVCIYENKLKAVEQLAMKDPLTGLANRRSVEERLEWIVAENQPHSIVVLDLNGFKQVNDKYGHAAGDDLLKQFAHELQKNVRSDDLVGRWGGDELIILLNRDLEANQLQLERMREWVFGNYAIENSAGKNKVRVRVEASAGLAQWLPGKTAKEVIEQADTAMYLDKQASRKTTPQR